MSNKQHSPIHINDLTISYSGKSVLTTSFTANIYYGDRIAIIGRNGTGKSSLISYFTLLKTGIWEVVDSANIGYLDQHYSNLAPDLTAIELMQQYAPNITMSEIRDHLNSYLLRKNEEVNLSVKYLSGGEKVRLSLALIGAKLPKLLILDEITNNIDLETKLHLHNILRAHPGSYILIKEISK
jgi:ATPase subunit of ABC transporter with duplicated ATPase domains